MTFTEIMLILFSAVLLCVAIIKIKKNRDRAREYQAIHECNEETLEKYRQIIAMEALKSGEITYGYIDDEGELHITKDPKEGTK